MKYRLQVSIPGHGYIVPDYNSFILVISTDLPNLLYLLRAITAFYRAILQATAEMFLIKKLLQKIIAITKLLKNDFYHTSRIVVNPCHVHGKSW